MEEAEAARRVADAKVERLRLQKKRWREKFLRALRRGIASVEELERVEKEEAEREAARQDPPSAAPFPSEADFNASWDSVFGDVSSLPAWTETPSANAESSQGELLIPTCFLSRRNFSIRQGRSSPCLFVGT